MPRPAPATRGGGQRSGAHGVAQPVNELFLAVVLSWSIVDGDTVRIQGEVWPNIRVEERVRMLRIDTPELRGSPDCEHRLAVKATEYTKASFTAGARIVVRATGRDNFGRVLAEVYIDGVNFNDQIIAAGFARRYGVKGAWC